MTRRTLALLVPLAPLVVLQGCFSTMLERAGREPPPPPAVQDASITTAVAALRDDGRLVVTCDVRRGQRVTPREVVMDLCAEGWCPSPAEPRPVVVQRDFPRELAVGELAVVAAGSTVTAWRGTRSGPLLVLRDELPITTPAVLPPPRTGALFLALKPLALLLDIVLFPISIPAAAVLDSEGRSGARGKGWPGC